MGASVRLYGHHVGILETDREGNLSFQYSKDWLEAGRAGLHPNHPLSLSLDFSQGVFHQNEAGPFFDGLLPDNPNARRMLADHFQIDQNDDFNLLFELGRECPGAVTIMPLDAPELTEQQVRPTMKVVDDKTLGRLLRDLPQRPLFVDTDGEVRMSLAGVQNKSAVILTKDGIALPQGNTPTTHIVKIDITSLPESTKIENFCLRTAAGVGIKTAPSAIRQADGIDYLIVGRYDRTVSGPEGSRYIRRLHQEDFCQALGRFPREKYEKDGGPGWKESFDLMKRMADPLGSRNELLSRAVFQFLIGNPDAHAKNYSLLYRPDGIHLSPFYDVNNAAAFKSHYKAQRTRLAMFVGGERDPELLTPEHWTRFADEIGMRPDTVFDRLYDLAAKIPATANRVRNETVGTPAHSHLMDIAIDDITSRCRRVLEWRSGPDLKPEPELAGSAPKL